MTPKTRKLIRAEFVDEDKCLYGNNWLSTAACYQATYPGFNDDQCKATEAFSTGVTPKQYREKGEEKATTSGMFRMET